MDISQVFSIADTLVGVGIGVAGGSFATLSVFARKGRKKENKVETLISQYGREYAERSKVVDDFREKFDLIHHDFKVQWPDVPMYPDSFVQSPPKRLARCDKELKTILDKVTLLKNTHVDAKDIQRIERTLVTAVEDLTLWQERLETSVTTAEKTVKKAISTLKSSEHELKRIQALIAKTKGREDEARQIYDPVYLEAILPAWRVAEKAVSDFKYLVKSASWDKLKEPKQKEWTETLNRALIAALKYYNAVDEAFDFQKTVLQETAKMRKTLARIREPETRDHILALVVKAENMDYTSGNPKKAYEAVFGGKKHLLL